MRLAKETIINFIGSVVTSIAGFAATVIIARYLGAEALGVYSLGLALILWLDIPSTGLQQAMVKRVSEDSDQESYLTAGIISNVATVAVIGGLMLVFRSPIQSYIGRDIVPLLVVLFGAKTVFGSVLSGLHGQKQIGLIGWVKTLERVIRTLSQVGLILIGYAVAGLIAGYVASIVVSSLIGLYFYSIRLARPQFHHLRHLIEYAKYAWISNLQGKAFSWIDTITLGFFVTGSLIGIYEVAWSLASMLVLVNSSIMQTLFPEVSELNETENEETISEHIHESLAFAGITIFPGFVGAVVVGPEILKIYSSEFAKGYDILLLLIFARMMGSIGEMFNTILNGLDRPDIAVRIMVPVFVSNIVLNILLISQIGWYGAAIATALTGIIYSLFAYAVITRLVGNIIIPTSELLRQIAASCVMGVVILILDDLLASSHYMTVGIVAIGVAIYVLSLTGFSPRFRKKLFGVCGSFL